MVDLALSQALEGPYVQKERQVILWGVVAAAIKNKVKEEEREDKLYIYKQAAWICGW